MALDTSSVNTGPLAASLPACARAGGYFLLLEHQLSISHFDNHEIFLLCYSDNLTAFHAFVVCCILRISLRIM